MVLAATDPAQPYGAALSWPKLEGGRKPSRVAGAYLVTRDGDPLLYVERGGRGLLRLRHLDQEEFSGALEALTAAAADGLVPRLGIERVDGEPAIGSEVEEALVDAGFSRQPRRLVAAA